MINNSKPLTHLFAALGDPVRFAITERLLDQGPQSAGDIGTVADISAPAISRHLKVLREAGLITQSVDRQKRIYAINPAAVHQIDDWLKKHEALWTSSLDRLSQALSEEE